MLETIRKIKINWLGHYMRRDLLTMNATEGMTDVKRGERKEKIPVDR